MPLQLTRAPLLTTISAVLVLGAACSDAKPRPTVVEPSADAAAEASSGALVDAGADAACGLPGSFGSSSCNACVAQTCCGLLATCLADKDCKARVDCELGCLDEPDAGGCAAACEAAIPDDRNLHYDLWGCVYFKTPCDFHCSTTR